MGFSDEDYEKAEKVVSKSQLYKQAGNSIVVNVLMEIFKEIIQDACPAVRVMTTTVDTNPVNYM